MNTNEIQISAPYIPLIPTEHEMSVYQVMATQAVDSKLYRSIGDVPAVKMIMMAAREINVPPMMALNKGIHIINGCIEISARLMSALIFQRGHKYQVESSTAEQCTILGTRGDNGVTLKETFTFEEAKQAGLIKEGGGWRKWPKDMCYARCMSRLARRLFPDVIGMGYVEGEIHEKETKPGISPMVLSDGIEISHTSNWETNDISMEENETSLERDKEMLKTFLAQFDKDEARGWGTYIQILREKAQVPLQEIVKKYAEDPKKAAEKFQSWISKQKNPS